MNKEYKTFEELKEELGDKFEEFMYKVNIELLEKVNQLETNKDEAIQLLNNARYHNRCTCSYCNEYYLGEIQEILERGKE